jgi:hypothetical protein
VTGSNLPGVHAAAAMARLTALARGMKASGAGGGIDLLRAQALIGLVKTYEPGFSCLRKGIACPVLPTLILTRLLLSNSGKGSCYRSGDLLGIACRGSVPTPAGRTSTTEPDVYPA